MKKYIILLIFLSSCSTYPSKFKCSDARGFTCMMLRDVDKKIESGEIAEAYKNGKNYKDSMRVELE